MLAAQNFFVTSDQAAVDADGSEGKPYGNIEDALKKFSENLSTEDSLVIQLTGSKAHSFDKAKAYLASSKQKRAL